MALILASGGKASVDNLLHSTGNIASTAQTGANSFTVDLSALNAKNIYAFGFHFTVQGYGTTYSTFMYYNSDFNVATNASVNGRPLGSINSASFNNGILTVNYTVSEAIASGISVTGNYDVLYD